MSYPTRHRGEETIVEEPYYAPDPSYAAELTEAEIGAVMSKPVLTWSSDLDSDTSADLELERHFAEWDADWKATTERGMFCDG